MKSSEDKFPVSKEEKKKEYTLKDITDENKMKNLTAEEIKREIRKLISKEFNTPVEILGEEENVDKVDLPHYCSGLNLEYNNRVYGKNRKKKDELFDNELNFEDYYKKMNMKTKEDKKLFEKYKEIEKIKERKKLVDEKISLLSFEYETKAYKLNYQKELIRTFEEKFTASLKYLNESLPNEKTKRNINKIYSKEIDAFKVQLKKYKKEEEYAGKKLSVEIEEKYKISKAISKAEDERKLLYKPYPEQKRKIICQFLKSESYIYVRDLKGKNGSKKFWNDGPGIEDLKNSAEELFIKICENLY